MTSDISKKQWTDFVDIATSVIKRHPDLTFVETVALALDDDVYTTYEVNFFTVLLLSLSIKFIQEANSIVKTFYFLLPSNGRFLRLDTPRHVKRR